MEKYSLEHHIHAEGDTLNYLDPSIRFYFSKFQILHNLYIYIYIYLYIYLYIYMDHEIEMFFFELKLIENIISLQCQYSRSDFLNERKRISSSCCFASRYDCNSFCNWSSSVFFLQIFWSIDLLHVLLQYWMN